MFQIIWTHDLSETNHPIDNLCLDDKITDVLIVDTLDKQR